jgi:hypothetical protein
MSMCMAYSMGYKQPQSKEQRCGSPLSQSLHSTRYMLDQGHGSIITISSISAKIANVPQAQCAVSVYLFLNSASNPLLV